MRRVSKFFEEKFSKILGEEFKDLLSCLEKFSKNCIRVNILKIQTEVIKCKLEEKGWKLESVPWYGNAFFVEGKNIAKTLEYFLGYYFVQDASSLVPVLALDPREGEKILDICAAPGSKTTFIAELMRNKGMIVANDNNLKRIKALVNNIQKTGATNVLVTVCDGRKLPKYGIKFDKILLDPSCSGSGLIISYPRVLDFWSQSIVLRLSKLQKQLLASATKMLEEDGRIVYSTCSIDPEENEEVIRYGIEKLNLEVEKIEIKGLKYRGGIKEYNKRIFPSEIENCIRFYPFDNQTEGFFVCRLKKQA